MMTKRLDLHDYYPCVVPCEQSSVTRSTADSTEGEERGWVERKVKVSESVRKVRLRAKGHDCGRGR